MQCRKTRKAAPRLAFSSWRREYSALQARVSHEPPLSSCAAVETARGPLCSCGWHRAPPPGSGTWGRLLPFRWPGLADRLAGGLPSTCSTSPTRFEARVQQRKSTEKLEVTWDTSTPASWPVTKMEEEEQGNKPRGLLGAGSGKHKRCERVSVPSLSTFDLEIGTRRRRILHSRGRRHDWSRGPAEHFTTRLLEGGGSL